MKFVKFILAFIATVALSSYLSSVSMCLVVFTANPKSVMGHGVLDAITNILYTVPVKGALISAPICAMLTALLAVAVVVADLYEVFPSRRQLTLASVFVGAIPGFYSGKIAGSSACLAAAVAQNLGCGSGLAVGLFSFGITGALAGLVFALIYQHAPKTV